MIADDLNLRQRLREEILDEVRNDPANLLFGRPPSEIRSALAFYDSVGGRDAFLCGMEATLRSINKLVRQSLGADS